MTRNCCCVPVIHAFGYFPLVGLAALALLAAGGGPAGSDKRQEPHAITSSRAPGHGDLQRLSFNWSLRRVEGLVLTDVHFRGRKVLKYAGIAELFTVYDQGSPRPVDFDQNGL